MRGIIYETSEIVQNKNDAISKAKDYLDRHPNENDVYVLRYDRMDEIWFIAGRENTENIINFVKVA